VTPTEIAEKRCKGMANGDRAAYLLAFSRARDDAEFGDPESRWLRMLADRRTPAAALAGYTEGLASTRTADTAITSSRGT
jgi:hypothetical protein